VRVHQRRTGASASAQLAGRRRRRPAQPDHGGRCPRAHRRRRRPADGRAARGADRGVARPAAHHHRAAARAAAGGARPRLAGGGLPRPRDPDRRRAHRLRRGPRAAPRRPRARRARARGDAAAVRGACRRRGGPRPSRGTPARGRPGPHRGARGRARDPPGRGGGRARDLGAWWPGGRHRRRPPRLGGPRPVGRRLRHQAPAPPRL
ncbi:MAG: hypothetical protein AVDCRST_MAG36-1273, partial [uncultured Nocardioidaceae bacterium]